MVHNAQTVQGGGRRARVVRIRRDMARKRIAIGLTDDQYARLLAYRETYKEPRPTLSSLAARLFGERLDQVQPKKRGT